MEHQQWWHDPKRFETSAFAEYLQLPNTIFDRDVIIPPNATYDNISGFIESLLPEEWQRSLSTEVRELTADMTALAAAMHRSTSHCCSSTTQTNILTDIHQHRPLQGLTCRLALLQGVRCPKWHFDHVSHRLLTTYLGPGTDWTDPGNHIIRLQNQWRSMRDEDLHVQEDKIIHAPAGEVMVIAGKRRPDRIAGAIPILHRSPISNVKRLLYTITVAR
jgi:hypothetical protein